jgi:hypothetical protein
MFHLNQYEACKVRRDEIQREFRRANSTAEIRRQLGDRQPLYASVLASVGEALVEFGSTLQRRYGDLVEDVQQVEADCIESTTRPSTVRNSP